MNIILRTFFAGVVCFASARASLNTSLHAYWDFEGSANNNGIAAGGAAFNGSLTGGATTGGTPQVGTGALLLDGVNDYMDVTSSVNVNQPWTVSAWYRSDIAPSGSTRNFVYESVGSYAISFGLREGSPTTDTNHQLFLQRTGGDISASFNLSDAATANNWHHIIEVFTPSTPTATGSLIGYLDGVQRYTLSIPANSTHGTATGFHVGTYRSANDRWFDGTIDEVAKWTRSLTPGDAASVYSLGLAGLPLAFNSVVKADNLTALGTGSSWTGASVPAAGEVAVFNSTYTQAAALTTSSPLSLTGIQVSTGAPAITINNTAVNPITLGLRGLNMSSAARDLTIANLATAAGNQVWDIAASRTFSVGSLTGNGTVWKQGSGQATLTDISSFTGTLNSTAGTVLLNTTANQTMSGVLGGAGAFTKASTGMLTLSNSNTNTGLVTINNGTLRLAPGAQLYQTGAFFGVQNQNYLVINGGGTFETWNWNYGIANSLAQLRANYGQVLLNGGTIRMNDTFSAVRAFTVGANGGTLEVTAGNTYTKPAGTVAGQNIIRFSADSNLTITGAGDTVIGDSLGAPGYGNTGFSITKAGSGTLTLSGSNAYTGGTTMSSGQLVAVTSAAIPNAGTFRLEGGTLRLPGVDANTSNKSMVITSANFQWGSAVIAATTQANQFGVVDRTDPLGAPSGPSIFEGNYIVVDGNLTTGSLAGQNSVLDLGSMYQGGGLRYNQLRVSGTLDLASASDTLLIGINPFQMRPSSPNALLSGDWGTLVLVHAETINGFFTNHLGITSDGIGWQNLGFGTTFTDPSALPMDSYYIEYRTGFGPLAGGDAILFHYKVSASVPEPDTLVLLAAGLLVLRAFRRR